MNFEEIRELNQATKERREQEQTIQTLRKRNAELESPIFREILAERREQDVRWGGPSHDDTHLPFEWCQYIDKFRRYARDSDSASEYEHRLIQIAALAVAAVESSRRLNPIGEGVGALRAKPEVVCPHCDELRSERDRALSELAEIKKKYEVR